MSTLGSRVRSVAGAIDPALGVLAFIGFISQVGIAVMLPLLPLYATELGAPPVVLGLLTSLFIPRRRVWVKATEKSDGVVTLEYAGLARGEDPRLEAAVADIAAAHKKHLGLKVEP